MTTLPLTGSLLRAYNNLPAIPPKDPLGNIINQLFAGGGGGVTGAPNALVYINPLGTGVVTDALLTVAPVDPAGRPQIHDLRVASSRGPIWRQGAWQLDGDPGNGVGEGFVTYGANALGLGPNFTDGGYGFVTPYSFGRYQIIPGVNGGNTFLVCGFEDGSVNAPFGYNGFFVVDNNDNILFNVDRATFNTIIGSPANPSRLFINQAGALHGSNAGVQESSLVANRASARFNQYGANTGVPGITGFKSRGATIGSLAKVVAGDTLWRATAIGVADDDATIGLAATLGIDVPVGGVPVGQTWVATDLVCELQPLGGPVNGRKQAFKVDSEGIVYVKESANCMAGIAVIGAGGNIVVNNTRVTATTRFQLTAQDGGAVPTGSPFVVARVVGTSFTIQSTAGAADAGVNVYYQLFEPTAP
jgi:hypothetical protein